MNTDWLLILLLILAITDAIIQRRRAYIFKDILWRSFGLRVTLKKIFSGKGKITVRTKNG